MRLPEPMKVEPIPYEDFNREFERVEQARQRDLHTPPSMSNKIQVDIHDRITEFSQLSPFLRLLAILSIVMVVIGIVLAIYSVVTDPSIQTGAVVAISVFALVKEMYFVVEKLQTKKI